MLRDLGLTDKRTWLTALAALTFLIIVGGAFAAAAVAVGIGVDQ